MTGEINTDFILQGFILIAFVVTIIIFVRQKRKKGEDTETPNQKDTILDENTDEADEIIYLGKTCKKLGFTFEDLIQFNEIKKKN